ncbi:MAG: phage head-tail connector protein [Phycisphaerales bacterium]|jgi:hypothetical protein
MTASQRLDMVKDMLNISDDTYDALLTTYLDFAKRELLSWRYGYSAGPIARVTDSEDETVDISLGLFNGAMSPVSGIEYVFTYSEDDESWQYDSADVELVDYGLEYPDDTDPVDEETITVKYSEAALVEFDTVMVQAVVNGYSMQGAEGQTAHAENGISRQWKNSDMAAYIRSNVAPMAGVV